MNKELFQKIKKMVFVCISVFFWMITAFYAMIQIYAALELPSFYYTNLEDIMIFQQKMSVFLLIMSILSVILNKKILMILWPVAIFYTHGFYMIFPEYEIYTERETCLDLGNGVWDYAEHRCRTDCVTWNKEQGCVKEQTKTP